MSMSIVRLMLVGVTWVGLLYFAATMPEESRPPRAETVPRSPVADLVLINGRIYTADEEFGIVEGLALRAGRVLLAGSSEQALDLGGDDTRVINLEGRFAMPGFNDAHGHLANAAMQVLNLDLSAVGSLEELKAAVATQADRRESGTWIYGRGWDESLWSDRRMPTRDDLDEVSGAHPVYLERADGHSAVVNSLALQRAGIGPDTPDPDGGVIVRDDAGRATGWLKEKAVYPVEALIPDPSTEQWREGLIAVMGDALENGVTSIQDDSLRMGAKGTAAIEVLSSMRAAGELPLRITTWLPFEYPIPLLHEWRNRLGNSDPYLKAGLLKTNIDGSGGSLSAAMLEPYATDPENVGLLLMDPERLNRMVIERDAAGFQIGIHTIGDRANRLILDAFEMALETNGRRDARHRVEHAQFLHDDDVGRFAPLGVIASMQPCHLLTDMRWAPDILGADREHEGYRWNSLLASGARIVFGTDFPVESINPMRGLYAAVAREAESGGPPGGWIPSEAISIEQAIHAYTVDSAYAEFEDQRKGRLIPGQFADLVVLSRDLTRAKASQILETEVLTTIVDGVVRYERN
jgi:predicted amidohydrolase YtcJ